MPYFDTAEVWLAQSTLLLKARPTTTRITTKYSINPPIKRSKLISRRRKAVAATTETTEAKSTSQTYLVLKTYDEVSGATLKYKTDKAADVGRLIASLGRLGRNMAALPEEEHVIMDDGAEVGEDVVVNTETPPVERKPAVGGPSKTGGAPPPTGKKGKKKGKK